jgi:LacI family transcriptional regulator
MTTIYDVAALAGVSAATVSRVFNQQAVSTEKVRLVTRAAEELNFTPNRTARSLRKKNSEIIALVIPDIENPYFTSLARGVEDAAQESGYSIVLCNTDDDPAKETRYLGIAMSENMAGVIIATAADSSDLSTLISRNRPVVAVDRITSYEIDRVMTDDWSAGSSATTELVRRGFERIACITGPQSTATSNERARGWSDALKSSGAATIGGYLKHSDFRVEGGRRSMLELLSGDTPPDGVMVTNNLMGIGVLQALEESGISPSAFGVAVIGDLPFATISAAITTVRLPVRDMGKTALRMLIERIDGDTSAARTVVLQNKLIPASGTAAVKTTGAAAG